MNNLFDGIPAAFPSELFQSLLEMPSCRIERIVSLGHSSPPDFWHDQDQHEWVLLIQGAARLQFEDEVVEMQAGDWINIPTHKKHRVDWTTPTEKTIWLAVHYD